MRRLVPFGVLGACLIAAAPISRAAAQSISPGGGVAGPSRINIVVPQQWVYNPPNFREQAVRLGAVTAGIVIDEQVATTTLEMTLENPASTPQEAEVLVPVPAGASVKSFGYEGAGLEPAARLLPREEARRIYEEIVRRSQDPGLLEFAGQAMIRSSVFPIPARSTMKVWVSYEHLLKADGDRVDFVLPRSESFEAARVAWTINAEVRSGRPIATVYSPSHEIKTVSRGPGFVNVGVAGEAARNPGAFRLSYLLEGGAVSATLLAYPDAELGGGYFLLLAGVPSADAPDAPKQKREVTIVIDRSGSMRGEKIEQARAAAIQVLEGLDAGEAFNVIDYADRVSVYAPRPVVKDASTLADARAYLSGLQAEGGTDIHSALGEAVRQPPTEGFLPLIIFLTDGLPTVGNTSELAIRDDTTRANSARRRIFTFGVGYDVNAPLLDKIAETSRAASINVLPGETIETAVSTVFRRLSGPRLAMPELVAIDEHGAQTTRAVRELQPASLPDLFDGDQLVVLGQYRGDGPLGFKLTGDTPAGTRAYSFQFSLEHATTRNSYVPRLWASRKIANLIDEIRQYGASGGVADPATDPRMKELVDEIVRLSTKFGILTEYTAFLATEPSAGVAANYATDEAMSNLSERAMTDRAGISAVNQSVNIKAQQMQTCTNASNRYWNAQMEAVEITTVRQTCDQTQFKRGARWVDSRIIAMQTEQPEPDRVVEFGTDEYFDLADRLAGEGRAATVAVRGEVYLLINSERVLVKNPAGG